MRSAYRFQNKYSILDALDMRLFVHFGPYELAHVLNAGEWPPTNDVSLFSLFEQIAV